MAIYYLAEQVPNCTYFQYSVSTFYLKKMKDNQDYGKLFHFKQGYLVHRT